jgi:hypothetical protein
MKFTIVTRTKNLFLAKRSQDFLKLISKKNIFLKDVIKVDGLHPCDYQFLSEQVFLVKLFQLSGWVIHIDEDAYCWNLNEVMKIRKHMEKNNIHIMGCNDFNITWEKKYISPNPFFLICNMDKISKIGFEDVPYNCRKKILENFNRTIDESDSHYSFFWFLVNNGVNIEYLKNITLNMDYDINPLLLYGVDNKPFLIHSWQARFYNKRSDVKKKIDYCYDYAKERKCILYNYS